MTDTREPPAGAARGLASRLRACTRRGRLRRQKLAQAAGPEASSIADLLSAATAGGAEQDAGNAASRVIAAAVLAEAFDQALGRLLAVPPGTRGDAARMLASGVAAITDMTAGLSVTDAAGLPAAVGGLAVTASGMPSLLDQLAAFLETQHVRDATTGDGRCAGDEALRIASSLRRAADTARAMSAALDALCLACAPLGRPPPDCQQ